MPSAQKTIPKILEKVSPKITSGEDAQNLGVTFRDSKSEPVHGWYPYVEGFSASYIEGIIGRHSSSGIVYDPFGGSGTVNLIASQMGIESAFSEANPFMRFVAETKVNAREAVLGNRKAFDVIREELIAWMGSPEFSIDASNQDLSSYRLAFNGRDFFAEDDLRELLACREKAIRLAGDEKPVRDLFLLAISSVTVACSHMTRRADLRRRRPDEYVNRVVDVRAAVRSKLNVMYNDLSVKPAHFAPVKYVGADCRVASSDLRDAVSLILTSPPYLNGTSYIRNTKLELWLLGFIKAESQLSDLNKVCMVCGINNVRKDRLPQYIFPDVEHVASELDETSPDKRIPAMVRGYFSDMFEVLNNCSTYLKSEGKFLLDIGDSKFYGVHVPTHKLLAKVASEAGLFLENERVIARRHSRDKTPLVQVELAFEKRT